MVPKVEDMLAFRRGERDGDDIFSPGFERVTGGFGDDSTLVDFSVAYFRLIIESRLTLPGRGFFRVPL